MSESRKPREWKLGFDDVNEEIYVCSMMAMGEGLVHVREVLPESSQSGVEECPYFKGWTHEDLNKLVLENEALRSRCEKALSLVNQYFKNTADGCECGAEESDGTSVTCYLHEAMTVLGKL